MTLLSEIEQELSSQDPEERRQAAAHLEGASGEGLVSLLIRALGDEDWRVRKEATAVAVAHAPSADVLRGLLEALGPGENVGLRNAVVEALAGYGQAAVDGLSLAMPSLDADGRKLAVEALGRTELPIALLVLRPLLADPDPNVRATVAESVTAIASSCIDAAVPVLDQCLDSPDRLVRLAALDGLNRLGIILHWQRLERLVGDPILERALLVAAGKSAHGNAAPLLGRALLEARGAAWQAAVMALAEFAKASESCQYAARDALRQLPADARQRVVAEASRIEGDVELRRAALVLTGILGTSEGAETVTDALSDDRLAGAAEHALSLLGAVAVPALVARASSGLRGDRALCLELLGRLADPGDSEAAVRAARSALEDESPEVVGSALGALALIGDETCLQDAARFLATDSLGLVRTAAASALAAIALRHPERARTLAQTAAPDRADAQVAAVIVAALAEPVRGSLEADVEFLSLALSNDSAPVRRSALDAFAALGTAPGVEAVAFALADEEREVQFAAIRALGRMRAEDGSVAGLPSLLDLISRAPDEELAAAAIQALGSAGDPRVLPVLKPLVRSGSAALAVAAVEALGGVADPRRVEALTSALGHGDSEVVKAALRVLAHERDARVPAHIGACLDHEAWDVRRLAADLLGDIGADQTSELLRAKLSIEPEPLVKDAVQRALGEVESAGGVRRTTPPPRGSFWPR